MREASRDMQTLQPSRYHFKSNQVINLAPFGILGFEVYDHRWQDSSALSNYRILLVVLVGTMAFYRSGSSIH